VIPLLQVQEPFGMITVSPLFAVLIAACTSLTLHELAVIVFASAVEPNKELSSKANDNTSHFTKLVIGIIPYHRKRWRSFHIHIGRNAT
jgi:hypothetical protein